MKNFISCGNHPESHLTGSTVESMIDRVTQLGLKYFTITDNGYMTSVLRGYMYGKDKNIKIIPGVEAYFKDIDCKIALNTPSQNVKYYKVVLHALDQEAYQKLVLLNSDASKKAINVADNKYQVFTWADLEDLSKYNITITNSNVEDLITKNLITESPIVGVKYFQKVLDLFGDRFFPSIIPYSHDQYWKTMVEITLNGKSFYIPGNDRIETNFSVFATPMELLKKGTKHKLLTYIYVNKVRFKVKPEFQKIQSVKLIDCFQPLPTGDIQTKANKFIIELAKKHNISDRLLINNYSYYALKEDRVVQDMRLGGEVKISHPQHMRSTEEIVEYLTNSLNFTELDIEKLVENTHKWAGLFDNLELKYDYRLPEVIGDPKEKLMEIIKKVNRMKWDNPVYVARFREEFELFTKNGVIDLIPYFLPIADIFDFYKQNGYLTGPGRGSSGGALTAYLIGITHVDPIKYGLYLSRFLTLDRIQSGNLPDIDCDLEDRLPLVGKDCQSGYLYGKYGKRAAQISTRTLLRIKSAILDANRFVNNGKIEDDVASLSKSLPGTPQGANDKEFVFGYEDSEGNHIQGLLEVNKDLQDYAINRPKEWDIVQRCLSLPRQNSRHPCSFVISDKNVEETVPIFEVRGIGRITQPEAKYVEFAGLIKYDFLVVSSVKDIRLALDYINAKNQDKLETGYFNDNGVERFVWDLPEDMAVFDMLQRGKTETVFQLNTTSVTPFVKKIKPTSVIDCAVITSLVRPGPLEFIDESTGRNMVEEYYFRKTGRSRGHIEILNTMIPETHGILIFQEQVSHIAKELAGLSVIDAENVRIAVGKKKKKLIDTLKPKFIEGAERKVGLETATEIWNMIEKFARYGFNKCVSGDTKLLRNKNDKKELTIAEMYKARHDKEWAKLNGKESVGKKYRKLGYGKAYSKKGDVLCHNNIVNITFEGTQAVYLLETEGGRSIKCTYNHKFPTPDGDKKMLIELKVGEYLYVNEHKLSCGKERIISIEKLDIEEEVYNIEMEAPHHNFVTDTGIVTCNSHAVAYSVISYACSYLKHYYPLEWWAAVLSNAPDKEINENFYKYVRDMVLPPDINLSTEKISIDYRENKLRNKLSMISGLGVKLADKIITNRPYKDLNDFVDKKVCGASLTRKLIHVGVLDSLFEPKDTLLVKMKKYEDILEAIDHQEKLCKYDKIISESDNDKSVSMAIKNKAKAVKNGPVLSKIDSLYIGLTPLKDFQIKKSIFPTMSLDLNKVLASGIKTHTIRHKDTVLVSDSRGQLFPLFGGDVLQKIDSTDLTNIAQFCVPGYVIEADEFSYAKGAKKALRVIIDSSGYLSEKVIWPDYDSGELRYPKELKKGAVCFFFYYKKPGKPYTSVVNVVIESPTL